MRDGLAQTKTRSRCGSGDGRTREKFAPVEIQTSGGNFRGTNVFRFLHNHDTPYDSACFYLPPDRTLARRKSCNPSFRGLRSEEILSQHFPHLARKILECK